MYIVTQQKVKNSIKDIIVGKIKSTKDGLLLIRGIPDYIKGNSFKITEEIIELNIIDTDIDFKEGQKLHRLNTDEIHTFVRYQGNMMITEYDTEIGRGEDWTAKELGLFKEQVVATTNKDLELPLINKDFVEKYVELNGEVTEVSVEIKKLRSGFDKTYAIVTQIFRNKWFSAWAKDDEKLLDFLNKLDKEGIYPEHIKLRQTVVYYYHYTQIYSDY